MFVSVAIVKEKMINLIKKIRSNGMQSSNCMIFFKVKHGHLMLFTNSEEFLMVLLVRKKLRLTKTIFIVFTSFDIYLNDSATLVLIG